MLDIFLCKLDSMDIKHQIQQNQNILQWLDEDMMDDEFLVDSNNNSEQSDAGTINTDHNSYS